MRKLILAGTALAFIVLGGAAMALQPRSEGYICPVTGDELPCPSCCELNSTD